jgi:AAA family ATP:ADP antiporter
MRNRYLLALQLTAGLMFAHQIAGKAARDGLFLLNHGPAGLPAMITGAAAFSVLLSLLNGRFLRRIAPRSALPWTLGASGAMQLAECWLLRVDPALASIVIYLHMAGVGAVLLSTFWSMLNEEFDPREAKRQFGRIAAGGTAGGLLGGVAAERAVAWSGGPALMLLLAGLHLACGVFLAALLRGRPAAVPASGRPAESAAAPHKSPLLQMLGAIVLLGSVGAALLDYTFKVHVTDVWGRDNGLLRFFAFYHAGVALLSFVMQTGATRVVLEKFGLGKSISARPATLAAGSFLALVVPGAAAAGIARAAEAVVQGSIFRASYETCYTPVPPAEKRLAKTLIDVGAERGGDALGAALVWLCLQFGGDVPLVWMLGAASLVGVASVVLCGALDRVYLKALARSLQSRAVELNVDTGLDLTTRSLVLRPPIVRPRPARVEEPGQDGILRRVTELRSSDPGVVHAALAEGDVVDPLVAAQVCLLMARPEHAVLAQGVLYNASVKPMGLLSDLLLDPSRDVGLRRRIPRILGSVPGQRSADALLAGLDDRRFEVRMQCARALVRVAGALPRPTVPADRVLACIDRELAVGGVLWESHRQQLREPSDAEWLDDLLRDKAHGSLEYVFTLLSLLHDSAPLMAAFRSLHAEDRRMRGTALEYLEGLLPVRTRELLWDILQERPSRAGRSPEEIRRDLESASETVVLRLRRERP